MKVNFKVKMKVTIEFLVEIYSRNDFHFFEKYFTWGNVQPSRDFLDTLYIKTKYNRPVWIRPTGWWIHTTTIRGCGAGGNSRLRYKYSWFIDCNNPRFFNDGKT